MLLCINDFENQLECINQDIYADNAGVNTASENLNELLTAMKEDLESMSNSSFPMPRGFISTA